LISIENCIGVSFMPLIHTKVAHFVHMGHPWSRWMIVCIQVFIFVGCTSLCSCFFCTSF